MKNRGFCFCAALAALALAAGCDYAQRQELKSERADRLYQDAMKDYSAGRLDAAASGLEKAVRANPANSSARFQLACLLQDRRQDYLGALCQYREYLFQEPDSDKSKIARDRAAICEKQLAVEIAKKAGASGVASAQELADAQSETATAKAALAQSEKRAADAAARVAALEREIVRLRKMVSSVGAESGDAAPRRLAASARELLEEDDDEGDRLRLSPEAVALFDEDERADAPRPANPGYGGPTLAEMVKQNDGGGESAKAHGERPEFYVVEEGDTLYRIALRFYGRRDAWRTIQEANKATISSDARIKAGQKIRLP